MTTRDVIEITTSADITLWVTPLTVQTQQDVIETIEAQYSLPDAAPYARAVDPAVASRPGQTVPGEDSQEWQQAAAIVQNKRNAAFAAALIEVTTELRPQDVELLIELHTPYLARLATVGVTMSDDPTRNIIRHVAVRTPLDGQLVIAAAQRRLPLKEGEVAAALKIFRPNLPRAEPNGHHAEAQSPGVTEPVGIERVNAVG